jgi:hypothetical protein
MEYTMHEVYISREMAKLRAGEPILCEIMTEDGEVRVVKAQIATSKEELPGADDLVLWTETGEKKKETLAIKILEVLDEEEVELPPPPAVRAGVDIGGFLGR